MRKLLLLTLIPTFAHAIDLTHFKVTVDTEKAVACIPHLNHCENVLIGNATPKGTFRLQGAITKKKGYGDGNILVIKEEQSFVYAFHTVWLGNPKEKRSERLKSQNSADRNITNGCINATPEFMELLRKNVFYAEIK